MRWLKYIVIGLASLIIFSVTLIVAFTMMLDQEQFRDLLVQKVNQHTDHHLEINGPLELDFSLSPSVKVSDIYFKTAADDIELDMAELHLQLDLLSIFSKYVIVNEFLVRNSVVKVYETPDDNYDWLRNIRFPFIEKLSIDDFDVSYWSLDKAEPLRVNLDSLAKEDITGADTILIKGNGSINEKPFRLEGESAPVATLLGEEQPFPFNVHFDFMQAFVHAEGKISNPQDEGDLDIALQINAQDLREILTLLHSSAPDFGRLAFTGRLAGTIESPRLDGIELNVSKDKVAVQASGRVGHLSELQDINLDFSTAVSDARLLASLTPEQIPRFNTVNSSGNLSGSVDALTLSDFTLHASASDGHKLEINGSTRITDTTQPFRDLDAAIAIKSPDTEFAREFIETVPRIGPLSAKASLSSLADAVVIRNFSLSAGKPKQAHLEIQGDIGHVSFAPALDVSNMNLKFNLAGPSAREINERFDSSLPDAGPVKLGGRYAGSISRSRVSSLHLQIGTPEQLLIDAKGEIKLADLRDEKLLAGINMDINLEAPNTTSLSAIAGTEIPALGHLKGSAHLSDTSGIPAITTLDIKVEKGSDFRVTLNGSLADLGNRNGLDMNLGLFASDMNVIGQFFDQPLPEEGAVKLTGAIKGSLEKPRYTGRINLRNTVINTDLTGEFSGEQPRLAGSISTPNLDIHDFGYYPEPPAEETSAPASEIDELTAGIYTATREKDVSTTPLFSTEPFNLSGMQVLDLDLEISINQLTSTYASVDSIHGHVVLEKGRLDIRPVNLLVAGDLININGTVNSLTKPPEVSLLITGDDIDLGLVLENPVTKKSPIRGVMTIKADISGRGQSEAELAASLDGHIYIVAENAKTKKTFMNLVNVDVVGFVISNILSPKQDINIGCAIFSMQLDKGMGATDLFVIDSPDTLIKIDTDINLANETMDIAILPEYKVRLFKKNKPMRIYGPISNPTYEVVSLAELTREATRSWLLAPITISTSLLQNITGLNVKPDEPRGTCDQFLE